MKGNTREQRARHTKMDAEGEAKGGADAEVDVDFEPGADPLSVPVKEVTVDSDSHDSDAAVHAASVQGLGTGASRAAQHTMLGREPGADDAASPAAAAASAAAMGSSQKWPFEHHVNFHTDIALSQFAYHVLYPFSLPVYLYMYGHSGGAWNQLFIQLSPSSLFLNNGLPALFWALLVTYALFYSELEQQGVQAIEFVQCAGFYLLHKIMVSIKYGYFSNDEMRWFLTTRDRAAATRFMSHKQLISGWGWPNFRTLDEELAKAQVRASVNLGRQAYFVVPRAAKLELAKWKSLLGEQLFNECTSRDERACMSSKEASASDTEDIGAEYQHEDVSARRDARGPDSSGNVVIDGRRFALGVLLRSVKRGGFSPRSFYVVYLIVLLQAALPGIARVLCSYLELTPGHSLGSCGHGFFGEDLLGHLFTAGCLLLCISYCLPFVGFLLVALNDIFRRRAVMQVLGFLLALHTKAGLWGRGRAPSVKVPTNQHVGNLASSLVAALPTRALRLWRGAQEANHSVHVRVVSAQRGCHCVGPRALYQEPGRPHCAAIGHGPHYLPRGHSPVYRVRRRRDCRRVARQQRRRRAPHALVAAPHPIAARFAAHGGGRGAAVIFRRDRH